MLIGTMSVGVCQESYTPGEPIRGSYEGFAQPFFESHCYDCHSGEDAEGGLNLASIGAVSETNAATWKSIWAQVALREMPPKDADL